MMQTGLFDWQTRFEQLDNGGDPLVKLNAVVNWETFRKSLEKIRDKDRQSAAGRKPFDVIVMFKILIVQSLYNLSDDQAEFQRKPLTGSTDFFVRAVSRPGKAKLLTRALFKLHDNVTTETRIKR
jgi:hypothetical protein